MKLKTTFQVPSTDINTAGDPTNSYVQVMNGIPAGTNAYERLGSEVTLKSLTMHMHFTHSANQPPVFYHLLFYWVRDWNGATSDLANDVFTATDDQKAPAAGSNLTLAPVSSAQMRRYRIIYSKRWVSPNTNQATAAAGFGLDVQMHKKIRLNLKGTVTRYLGTTAVIGDIAYNALLMRLIINDAVAAHNFLGYTSRLRFYDA